MSCKLLIKLKQLRDVGPELNQTGICDNLGCTKQEYIQLRQLYQSWPHFSGNLYFPVPHPMHRCSGLAAEDAFDNAAAANTMWNQETSYGALRWDLLNHCIAQLEIQLT